MTASVSAMFEEVSDEMFNFLPRRIWAAFFLAAAVAFGLALAYVQGGGIELLDNQQFLLIDQYAFYITYVVAGIGVAGSYLLYFRDVSSTLAVLLALAWALCSGLQDLFVYLLLPDTGMPNHLAWLDDSKIGIAAQFLGFEQVTPLAIYSVILVEFALLLVLSKILYEFERAGPLGLEV